MLTIVLTWRSPFLGVVYLTEDIRFNMNFVFMYFAILSFGLYIAMDINLWIGLFLCYALFSTSRHESSETGAALLSLIFASMILVVFYNTHNKNVVITAFALFAVANFVLIIAQLLDLDLLIKPRDHMKHLDHQIRMGIVDNRNSLSAAFAICFPVFWHRLKWGIPIVILGLIFAKTVGGVIATIPTFAYFGYYYFGKKVIIFALILLLALIAYLKFVDRPDYKWRWETWKLYAELRQKSFHNKWFGLGLGKWKEVYGFRHPETNRCIACDLIAIRSGQRGSPIYMKQAHSEPVQLDFEMGYTGVGLVIGYLISILTRVRNIRDPRPVLILLAFIINSMVYFPLHIPILGILFILAVSWLENELTSNNAYSFS